MRFLELQLLAYGPFTDLKLDLSAGQEGLHVIYGPNEAGKSTTLRALGCLLYGFEHKCDDAFLHDQTQLRVGAIIRGSDGTELSFVRRKGRKDTLLDFEKNPLLEGLLARFLAGTSREVFFSRFGIGFKELREEDSGILAGQGDVGTALASTGFGGLNLHRVLDNLDQEAEDLFKPRGQNQKINETISRYVVIRDGLKILSTNFTRTLETESLIVSTRKKVEDIRVRLEKLNQEKSRLTRLQSAIPKLARREDLLDRKAVFGEVIRLPNDFPERRRSTQQSLDNARKSQSEAEEELKHLQEEMEKLETPHVILKAKEEINGLHQKLGALIQAVEDKPGILVKRSQTQAQAEQIAKSIPGQPSLAALLEHELTGSQRHRLVSLATQHARLAERRESAERQVANLTKSLETMRRAFESLPTPRSGLELKGYLEVVSDSGDLEKIRAESLHSMEVNESQAGIEAARLPGWRGTLAELETLSLPSHETVSLYVKRFQGSEGKISELSHRKTEADKRLKRNDLDLAKLLKEGAVPTEEDLETARARREQGWALVRRAWLEGQDIAQESASFDSTRPLPDAYEACVTSADEVSDLLRTEAVKVERHATLLAQGQDIVHELQEVTGEQEMEARILRAAQEEWVMLWAKTGITPLSPQEMTGWLAKIPPILQRLERIRVDRVRLGQIEETIRKHREGLSQHLVRLGEKEVTGTESLREVLIRARAVVAAIEEVERKREDVREKGIILKNQLEEAKESLTGVQSEQTRWETDWKESVTVLGPVIEVTPHSLQNVLQLRDEALQKVHDTDESTQRVQQIDGYLREYQDATSALVQRIDLALINLPPHVAIQTLAQKLESAQKVATQRTGFEEQINKTTLLIEKQATITKAEANHLARLIQEAGCATVEDLPQAEERSAAFLRLESDLDVIENGLIEIAPMGDLSALIREAGGIDRDTIEGSLASIKNEIDLLESENSNCHQEIGKNEQILSVINGNDDAAKKAGEAQSLLAGIHTDAQRYIRLKLAAGILREAVERFRRENQGPLLERAGAIFRVVSLGNFAGLETDFGENDEPILRGVHGDGTRLKVEEMSDGARDQLYLALRLAHLEAFLSTQQEKMPLIVDDILVHFDDQRAAEALKVLAGFSAKTQILFFTHHRHLVDLAQRSLPEGVVFVHELPGRKASQRLGS